MWSVNKLNIQKVPQMLSIKKIQRIWTLENLLNSKVSLKEKIYSISIT